MAEREKSALYPNVTWDECIQFIKVIDGLKFRSVSYSEVASSLGLNSVTTKSFTSKISTSKQFGLITTLRAAIVLTDTARKILYPTGDITDIKHSCFISPPLYNKLVSLYDGRALPSPNVLANILMNEHKIAKAAKDAAAKCFWESAEQLDLIKDGVLCYSSDIEPKEASNESKATDDVEVVPSTNTAVPEACIIQSSESDYITQSIPVKSGKVAKFIIPIDADADDLYLLRDMFDVILRRKFKLQIND